MVPNGLFDPSRRRRSRLVNDVTLISAGVQGEIGADRVGNVHRRLQVGMPNADVTIRDQRLDPVPSWRADRKQIHVNDVPPEPRSKILETFDVLDPPLSLCAL